MVFNFFKLQLQHPTKGDWVSTCINDLKKLKIQMSLEEIRRMAKGTFLKLVKNRIAEIALVYLINKRGSKGKMINYKRF